MINKKNVKNTKFLRHGSRSCTMAHYNELTTNFIKWAKWYSGNSIAKQFFAQPTHIIKFTQTTNIQTNFSIIFTLSKHSNYQINLHLFALKLLTPPTNLTQKIQNFPPLSSSLSITLGSLCVSPSQSIAIFGCHFYHCCSPPLLSLAIIFDVVKQPTRTKPTIFGLV